MDEDCRVAVHETGRLLESLGHRVSYVEVPVQRQAWAEAFLTLAAGNAAALIPLAAEMGGKSGPDPGRLRVGDVDPRPGRSASSAPIGWRLAMTGNPPGRAGRWADSIRSSTSW